MKCVIAIFALGFCLAGAFHLKGNKIEINALEGNRGESWESKPDFCQDYDCPVYDLENTTEDFEVRAYHGARFIHNKVNGYLYSLTMSRGFMPLLRYIQGGNAEERKFNMTVPVVAKFGRQGRFKVHSDVHFYMPDSFGKLPTPNNPRVKITTMPKFKAYVRTFGGYVMTMYQVKKQHGALLKALRKHGLEHEKEDFYFASYNKPTRFRGRHNEVWVMAK